MGVRKSGNAKKQPNGVAGQVRYLDVYEVGAFYWTVLTPDIVNLGREEQGSVSV